MRWGGIEDQQRVTARAVVPILKNAVEHKCAERAKDCGITIELQMHEDITGFAANINESLFLRGISNLLNNALDASKRGSKITVRASAARDGLAMSIEDQGAGMTNDQLKNVGTRGYTSGKAGGSGLGLHHAMQTAKSWGGRVDIESKLGVGTTVRMWLPSAT